MYGRLFAPIVFTECFALATFIYWAAEMRYGPFVETANGPAWFWSLLVALPITVFVLMIAFYLLWRAAIGKDTPIVESILHLLTLGFGYGVAWVQWGFWIGCLVITAALIALHFFSKLIFKALAADQGDPEPS